MFQENTMIYIENVSYAICYDHILANKAITEEGL